MGQANVRLWSDDILPLLTGSDDPLGVDDFATHRLPLSDAAAAYEQFQKKSDGTVKVLFQP
jgi:threonine dehydrogenase-like Zn-dependent dehydrogenase